MEMRWKELKAIEAEVTHLMTVLKVSKPIASLLSLRSIDSYEKAKTFFRPSLDQLNDPFLMKDMQQSIARITKAIEKKQKVMVYGDYDVDGSTAVSLVYGFFSTHYPGFIYYIPDRYAEGYGLSFQGVEYAKEQGVSLIITLDCGIKAVDKVAHANTLGIDIVICDHHTPGNILPEAFGIINPKQNDCPYPYKELPGCGIGFKLCWAFASTHNIPIEKVLHYLDLVAIAIACDIVPITGENRVLTYLGLQKVNESPNLGVTGLLETAKTGRDVPVKALSVEDLVFKIGPRINAAGRIKHAREAVALLSNGNKQEAQSLALLIHAHNEERKGLDKQTTAEALQMMQDDPFYAQAHSTVVYKEDWHKGVIGIVASRLIENHYKPTIVFTKSGEKAAGSARSVKNYNVYEAIDACSDLLIQFGGHKYAAGLTIKPENISLFRDKFDAYVASTIKEEQRCPEIEIDAVLDFIDLTEKFYRILKQFAPFGPQNMKPIFKTKNVVDAGGTKLVGADKTHVKFHLKQQGTQEISFNGIGFGMGDCFDSLQQGLPHDILYTLEENHWKGSVTLQLMVKAICLSEQ